MNFPLKLEVPTSIKEVRFFLGLVGYYRRFILGFSNIAAPLFALTMKNQRFIWDKYCQEAFEELKGALISAPILAMPTDDDMFVLDTDASDLCIGAVLSQIQNGQERVIAYAHSWTSREKLVCYAQRTFKHG